MAPTFDPKRVARFLYEAHADRAEYQNVPTEFAPTSIAQAYAAQAALAGLLAPREGGISGFKIATTTRVMQQLMGIDHPCGGLIFEKRVRASPAEIRLSEHVNLMLECELAVRLARSLPKSTAPYTAANVAFALGMVMPAFELIEDRRADYRRTNVLSMIADNCWNAGVVLGSGTAFDPHKRLAGIPGTVTVDGRSAGTGATDDPLSALAWIANLVLEQGRSLEAGAIVITGSIIPTFAAKPGQSIVFGLEGLGRVELVAR